MGSLIGSLIDFFRNMWKVVVVTAVVSAILTIVFSFGTLWMEKAFSSDKFCTSCHSMSYPKKELEESTHFGALGADPKCEDCHLPPNFIQRVESHIVDGTRGLIGEFVTDLKTKEAFDRHRAEYAHNARLRLRQWDSSPCKVCHKNSRPSSEEAEKDHERMLTEDITCIDCHQNLVHEEVPEEDIAKGKKEGRIVLKEEEEE